MVHPVDENFMMHVCQGNNKNKTVPAITKKNKSIGIHVKIFVPEVDELYLGHARCDEYTGALR
jgi:hypothetical protein